MMIAKIIRGVACKNSLAKLSRLRMVDTIKRSRLKIKKTPNNAKKQCGVNTVEHRKQGVRTRDESHHSGKENGGADADKFGLFAFGAIL